MVNRTDILMTANEYITKDRAATHGDAEDSFAAIGNLWGEYLKTKVTPADVAIMMVLFKIARFKTNPAHMDNAIDMAGYAALAAEIAGGRK